MSIRNVLTCKRLAWGIFISVLVLLQGFLLYQRIFHDWKGPVGTISNETFVPAVMIAAGRGFYVTDIDAVPGLRAFVDYKSARFDVVAIPKDAVLESPGRGYQWLRYMLYTVGYIWKIFGVSWKALAILTLVMLSVSAFAVYGISRLAMPAPWSAFVALAFTWNSAVYSQMPLFRDFSKAPFILVTVFLLARSVKKRLAWKEYIITAALIGVVAGAGMGFRTDMLILVPLSILVLFTCRLQPARYLLAFRFMAAISLILAFLFASYPVFIAHTSASFETGHDFLLGFSSRCNQEMGTLVPASYEKQYLSHDTYTAWSAMASAYDGITMSPVELQHALRSEHRGLNEIVETYISALISIFPADLLTRAYAAVLRCTVGLGSSEVPPAFLFESTGLLFVLCGLLLVAATDMWLAWQILLMLCLFCGYTSLQFGLRHAFHTSFVPYWFGCFTLYHVFSFIRNRRRSGKTLLNLSGAFPYVRRALLWLVISFLAFYVPLTAAKWVQHAQVAQLLDSYLSAPRVPIQHRIIRNWAGKTLIVPERRYSCRTCEPYPPFPPFRQRVLVARFKESPEPLNLDIDYEWSKPGVALGGPIWSYTSPGIPTNGVDVFFPVYQTVACDEWSRFAGLIMPDEQADLFHGFEEVEDIGALKFLLILTVPRNREAFAHCTKLRFPLPFHPPVRYPWPLDPYLYQNDEDILRQLKADDIKTAENLALESLQRFPESVHYRALLAQVYFQAFRDDEAWAVVDALLEECPEEYALYQRLDMVFNALKGAQGQYEGWKRIVETRVGDRCAEAYLSRAVTAKETPRQ